MNLDTLNSEWRLIACIGTAILALLVVMVHLGECIAYQQGMLPVHLR